MTGTSIPPIPHPNPIINAEIVPIEAGRISCATAIEMGPGMNKLKQPRARSINSRGPDMFRKRARQMAESALLMMKIVLRDNFLYRYPPASPPNEAIPMIKETVAPVAINE